MAGLSDSVTVTRDEWGVPQIYASNTSDLFIAQGFTQAQDRFFEMDFRRHITSGRLSELFGESQVPTDANIRTMGWYRTAEAEWDLLSDESRSYFEAYADGVNAYLADRSPGDVSLEYAMLGLSGLDYEIEPWSPIDSLAWLKAMAWDLRGNYTDELSRASLLAAGLSSEQVSELYPDYPSEMHTPIVPQGTVVDGEFTTDISVDSAPSQQLATAIDSTDEYASILDITREATESLDELLGVKDADGIGSNSWVISGDLTKTGEPILSNDPHLGATMPSVWYQIGLHCTTVTIDCPFNVTGFSFAGVPSVIIGHNAEVAWGFTNLGPDVTDFYIEHVNGDKYEVDGEWHDLDIREEIIEVFDGDPVTITVRQSGHGPLMSDLGDVGIDILDDPAKVTEEKLPNDGDYAVALRWTALDPGRTADAIFALNTASDFNEFRTAASLFEVPAQNLIYADTDGNIGYQSPGRIPIREVGDGTLPVPGWDSAYDWKGYIPFEELPSVLNPDEGFIVTANNEVIDDQYPYLLTKDWAYGYRSERIRDMISATGEVDVNDMVTMQMDSANLGSPPVLEALSELELNGVEAEVVSMFDNWDLQQTRDSAAAAAYNAIWRHLLFNTFDEVPTPPSGGERWAYVMNQVLADEDSSWWDVVDTDEVETKDDVLHAALDDAISELVERLGDDPHAWQWGDLHTLTVTHQTLGVSGVGVIEWMFNAKAIGTDGGSGIVNATGWNAQDGYHVNTVPSMRMVVDMADFSRSEWINLTGNSGHAFHAHYEDQLPLWQQGDMLPMLWLSEPDLQDDWSLLYLRP